MPLSQAARGRILAAYTAVVLALTLVPLPRAMTDTLPWWHDKAIHFALFMSLAVVFYWYRVLAGPPSALGVIGPVAALSGLIELAQGPLPHRAAEGWDFFWGLAGAAAGFVGARFASRERGTP